MGSCQAQRCDCGVWGSAASDFFRTLTCCRRAVSLALGRTVVGRPHFGENGAEARAEGPEDRFGVSLRGTSVLPALRLGPRDRGPWRFDCRRSLGPVVEVARQLFGLVTPWDLPHPTKSGPARRFAWSALTLRRSSPLAASPRRPTRSGWLWFLPRPVHAVEQGWRDPRGCSRSSSDSPRPTRPTGTRAAGASARPSETRPAGTAPGPTTFAPAGEPGWLARHRAVVDRPSPVHRAEHLFVHGAPRQGNSAAASGLFRRHRPQRSRELPRPAEGDRERRRRGRPEPRCAGRPAPWAVVGSKRRSAVRCPLP